MNFFELPFETGFDTEQFVSLPEIQVILRTEKFSLPLIPRHYIKNYTLDLLENRFNSKIVKIRMFVYPPMHMSGIHIDGPSVESSTKYALNFPIQNCKGTKVIFYKLLPGTVSSVHKAYTEERSYSISYDMREVDYIEDQLEIMRPTVINTSSPHNVYSPITNNRAILSIRFANCLTTTVDSLYELFNTVS